jgi:hypothetical protein
MAKTKGPEEIPAGAVPFVLTNPAADPNSGGTGNSSPLTQSYGSVKGKQARAGAEMTAEAVEEIVKTAMEKQKPELKVTSK